MKETLILAREAKFNSIEVQGTVFHCFPDNENTVLIFKYQKN